MMIHKDYQYSIKTKLLYFLEQLFILCYVIFMLRAIEYMAFSLCHSLVLSVIFSSNNLITSNNF